MSDTPRCGSTETNTGDPCQQYVSARGETCYRHPKPATRAYAENLTDKQRRFVEEYTKDWNATQAAIRAGYSEKTAAQLGYQLLQKPSVERAVQQRLERHAMTADEVLARFADIARSDIGRFIEVTEDGRWRLDLEAAEEAGLLRLVRELSYDSNGLPKIKLYDAKDALKQLARAHGLFVDKLEFEGELTHRVEGLSDEALMRRAEQLENRLAALRTNGARD